jgi:hypothetical protein
MDNTIAGQQEDFNSCRAIIMRVFPDQWEVIKDDPIMMQLLMLVHKKGHSAAMSHYNDCFADSLKALYGEDE